MPNAGMNPRPDRGTAGGPGRAAGGPGRTGILPVAAGLAALALHTVPLLPGGARASGAPLAEAPQQEAARDAPRPPGARPHDAARPQDGPQPLVLRDFLVRVLDRSLEAEAAALRREAAGHEAAALRRPLNPTLEAEGPDSEGTAQLQLRQPIRLFGQGDALRTVGRARRTLADRRLTAEHAAVAREAARAYVEAVAARRELALLERVVELRRDAVERAEAAFRQGWGGRESLQELRLEVRAAARQRDGLREAVRRDRRRLNHMMGRAPDEPLRLDGDPTGAPRGPELPVPDSLPADAPAVALARAASGLAEAELARARTSARPVPAVGPMVSVGDGLNPGLSLELALPLWSRNAEGVRAARARLEASQRAVRATRRTREAAYGRLLDRREALADRLQRLRSRELQPARREADRWTAARELGMPVADRRRRARARLLELRREAVDLQRRLRLLEVEAAWRSGSLLSWLRNGAAPSNEAPPARESRP